MGKIYTFLAIVLFLSVSFIHPLNLSGNDNWVTIFSDECIYDNNNHSAFTSMEEWKGNLMLAFREAAAHRATPTDKGKIKVLEKKNGSWTLQQTLFMEGKDLRDPDLLKLDDRLFLYTYGHYSELTDTGWTVFKRIKHDAPFSPSIWKRRVYKNIAYGIGFSSGHWPLLFKSTDCERWEMLSEYKLGGNASEADMVFIADTMYICIRIDSPIGSNSMWGKSIYPFTECKWKAMDISVASPELIVHSDNTILLAGREYDYRFQERKNARYVSLFALSKDGDVKGRCIIESQGGDQGYASFYRTKGNLYFMSYYAGLTNTAIRLLSFTVDETALRNSLQ